MAEPDEDPERALVLAYAPADARQGLAALFALDDALADVVRTTREPALGQLRLAWWDDALRKLDSEPAPAQPVLQALADHALPRGVSGEALAEVIDGWEVLITAETLDHAALAGHARERGERWFALAARVLEAGTVPDGAGEGWAYADLALHLSDAAAVAHARAAGVPLLDRAARAHWPARARALGAMVRIAQFDLAGTPPRGSLGRMARLAWHRISGR